MKNYSIILFVLMAAVSCQVHEQPSPVQKPEIRVEEGRLVFQSSDHFASSVAEVERGAARIEGQKLAGFNYKSYASVKDKDISAELSILSFKGFGILLNQSKEVQIAGNIYFIDHDITKVFSKNGNNLIETFRNSVDFFENSTKKFVSSKNNNSARTFEEWAYRDITKFPLTPSGYFVGDRFIRVNSFVAYYYYEWYEAPVNAFYPIQNTVYYKLVGGVCLCEFPAGNFNPQYIYSTQSGSIYLGASSVSYQALYGWGFSVSSGIKMPNYPEFNWGASIP